MSASSFTKLFEFFSLVGQLKINISVNLWTREVTKVLKNVNLGTTPHWDNKERVQRTGWVLRNVSDPESVADHMYRMSMMAFLVDSRSGLNKERCIKMSLVHDMAESIVGDITPADSIDKEDKHHKEKTAMTHITSLVSEEVGTELMNLWLEYEEQKTAESLFVKDLDKFEMIMQAYEYEQLDSKPNSLQEFFDSTEGQFKTETVRQWVSDLEKIRSQSSQSPEYSRHRSNKENSPSRNSMKVKPFMHSE